MKQQSLLFRHLANSCRGSCPVMACSSVIVYVSHRSWLSDLLINYGIRTSPLEEEIVIDRIAKLDIYADDDNDPSGDEYLKSLDPRRWKDQDHYAILGLRKERFRASDEKIKKNYRKKILVHHPDKRSVTDVEGDYFACITRAYDILGDPIKRRSYDSVDPTFNDDIPSVNAASKSNFYRIFGPVFERNARWSNKQPVPNLGNEFSTREAVDEFYSFWYNFDSWREYSYQDEEDKERGQDRDERRSIEKENKAVRLTKKKEEMSRIRQLVDNAYACDPRIIKFKEADKLKKEDEKKRKAAARKAVADEAARFEEEKRQEEAQKQAQLEEEEKQRKEAEKKEREAKKKARKKVKKQLENILESCNYFDTVNIEDNRSSNQTSSRGKVQVMIDFEKICHSCNHDEEELRIFSNQLSTSKTLEEKYSLFIKKLLSISNSSSTNSGNAKSMTDQNSNQVNTSTTKTWSTDDCFLLIKAAKLFPPGTKERWDVITTYLNQHSTSGNVRKTRDVMAKSKELQDPKVTATLKGDSVDMPQKNGLTVTAEPSERLDVPEAETPWTESEQRLLEQALITYPKDVTKRWDKIAEEIPTRSKEACIKRYKELVAMVQAKKQAIKQAASNKKQ